MNQGFEPDHQMTRFGVLHIAAMVLALAASANGAGQVLVVKPAGGEAGKTLDFAAAELSRYLKAITSKDYPVARESEGTVPATVRLVVDSALAQDEYHIHRVGPTVEIAGGSPRGCLYGAYRFLHALGCRWPLPGKQNELVPHKTQVNWAGPEIRSRPAVAHRGLMWIPITYDQDLLDIIDYLAKNGFNFVTICGGPVPPEFMPKLDEVVRARDMGVEWGGHLLPGYLPRSEFAKHPDYFRMEKGKRTASLNMCPSNPQAAAIIARNSLADWQRLKALPRLEMLHMWPDDLLGGGWCGCPKCAGLSDSDQSLKILNAVAERLPLGKTALAHLSYHATVYPPQKVKPHNNVRLFYAPRERCYRHAMGECEANRRYLGWLKAQIGLFPNQPEVMEYYQDLVLYRQMPMPLHPVIGRDVAAYRAAGAERITSLSFQRFSDWAYGVNYYVLGKALWRGEDSPEDVEEYCQALYGPAAGPMKRYFDRLFELCATAMETCGYEGFADLRYPLDGPFNATHAAHLAPLVAKDRLDEIERLVNDARKSVGEPYRSRVEQQATLWKVARLETQAMFDTMTAIERMKDFRAGRMTAADRRQTIALLQEAVANINQVGEILLAAPEPLRGPHVFRQGGLLGDDRLHGYVAQPMAWLKELAKEKP
jgi:hypothetical protein